jgi:hypothetical protein
LPESIKKFSTGIWQINDRSTTDQRPIDGQSTTDQQTSRQEVVDFQAFDDLVLGRPGTIGANGHE